jgi:drug/metabolite transporter (DMT)-like permease
MIYALYPLVVLALLALSGEKFTYRNIIRSVLGIAGVYLLIGPGGRVDLIGVGMVVLSLLASSLQIVFMQWFLQAYDGRTITFYMVVVMTLVVVGWWPISESDWHFPGWQSWLGVGVLAVVCTYLARLTMFAAVRSLGGGQVALLVPLETLLTVIWSIIFLQDRLTILQWLGGLLILMSALLAMQRLGRARWRPRWRALPRP